MTEKPAEHLADSIEHDGEMPTELRSTFTPDHGTEVQSGEPFQSDYDVITNLMALFTCFFASTWMLVVPSGTIGFISEAFPLESSKSIWIAAAVTIPNCVLQSFIGDISDHLGRKGLLLDGMLLGIAGTLITSRAKNMNMVIGGQVLSGCSVTIGYLAIPLANELVPKNQRPKIQALIGIFAGLANCTGVIIAGAFIKHSVGGAENGWRAAFYLGAGFFAVTFAALLAFYHPSARPNPENLSLSSKLRKMDWFGIFLVAAGLTIFLVGLEFGGNPYKWSSARVLAPLIVGGACLVGFGVWEAFGTKTGLLAHGFFIHPNYAIVLLLNFVGGMVLFGGQAFLPQEIIYLFTQDAVLTGVYNLPFNICGVLGGIIAGIVVQLTKESKHILIISFVILVTASGLMAAMQPHINFAAWFFPTGLLGITVGVQIALLPLVASICTPNHLIAQALGVVASTRAFGGSIGVIIFSQIFASKVKHYLPSEVAKASITAGLPVTSVPLLLEGLLTRNDTLLAEVPGISLAVFGAAEKAVSQSYADSFRFVWYSLLAFSAVSLILSFFIKPTKAQMTGEIAAEVEHRHHHLVPQKAEL